MKMIVFSYLKFLPYQIVISILFYTEFLGLSVFVGPRWVCDGYVGGHKTENLIDVFKANAWCDWDWRDIQTPNTVDYISYAV